MNAIGIDPNTRAAVYAENRIEFQIIPILLEEFNTNDTFDCITMLNIFEHTWDPIISITKVRRLLNSNGIFVLELPHIFTLQTSFSSSYWHHFQMTHNWFFNTKTIAQFLWGQGFGIEKMIFIPKVTTLSNLLSAIMARTVYQFISREKYLKIRESGLYRLLNNKKVEVNLKEYLFIICTKG